jgi:hypothetical protein
VHANQAAKVPRHVVAAALSAMHMAALTSWAKDLAMWGTGFGGNRDVPNTLYKWLMIPDNADDLRLFEVGKEAEGGGMNYTNMLLAHHKGRCYGQVETRTLLVRLPERVAVSRCGLWP